jgi:GNAT superfamily N-acetyltransferase
MVSCLSPNHIRRAEPHESRLLTAIALRSKAHWGYSSDFMDACRAELTYDDHDLVQHLFNVICAGDKSAQVVGFYCLVDESMLNGSVVDGHWEIDALFVDPSQIGKGYGRALLDHAKITAKSFGASALIIQSDPHAVVFYQRGGAELLGERESGSVPGRQLPLLSIAL